MGFEGFVAFSAVILFLTVFSILSVVHLKNKEDERRNAFLPFFVFISFFPLFSSGLTRANKVQKFYWEFDGVVIEKFISSNHAQKSIIVGDSVFEGVPSTIWENLRKGDKIRKEACGELFVNDQEFEFSP